MNYGQQTVQSASSSSILARNKTLRQTYILLAMTVAFSAFCAYIGMMLNVSIPWLVALLAIFGLSQAIYATRNSGLGIIFLFLFTGFLGLYLSNALNFYVANGMADVVFKALIGASVIFFALSAFVLVTGKNFNFLGGFLFTGVCVLILASLGLLFFQMTALAVAISAMSLMIFSGYVLYDTSKIMRGEIDNYIIATMCLFTNLLNIFISLLNLLSMFGGDE